MNQPKKQYTECPKKIEPTRCNKSKHLSNANLEWQYVYHGRIRWVVIVCLVRMIMTPFFSVIALQRVWPQHLNVESPIQCPIKLCDLRIDVQCRCHGTVNDVSEERITNINILVLRWNDKMIECLDDLAIRFIT